MVFLGNIKAVASLSPRVGKIGIFPQSVLIFLYFFLIFPQIFSFSSSFWSFGWATCPPGKALATPLGSMHQIVRI